MMTCGLLQIENEKKDDVVDLISFRGRKKRYVSFIILREIH
jgi:hypothetical protein